MLLSSERRRLMKYSPPKDVPTESSFGVRVQNKYTAYLTKGYKEPRPEKSRSLRRNNAAKKKKQLTPSVNKTPNKYKRRQKSPKCEDDQNVGPTINLVSPKKPDSYFVGRSDGSKVKKIVQRIRQIVNDADPSNRNRVLHEATVKYQNQVMTLQQFLDCHDVLRAAEMKKQRA